MSFIRKIFEPLTTAINGVVSHKLRSFLTMLGIVIGVGAVIALMSIGKGAESAILSSIQGLGTNLLFIQPGSTSQGGVKTAIGSAQSLTQEDAEAIEQEISNVVFVVPTANTNSQIVYSGQNVNGRITGITPQYQDILNVQFASGYGIAEEDYFSKNKVAVLGSKVGTNLFGTDDPVGQVIRMGQIQLRVIGLLQPKGASMLGDVDNAVLIPLTTMYEVSARLQTTKGEHIINSIVIQVTDPKLTTTVTEDVTSLLRYRHQLTTSDNDFTITSQQDLINTISGAMGSLTFLLGAIAAISLLVGGIGVMNIMLVSVIERTREIGIRKALGAREIEIVAQFLIEALLLTITGGAFGIAFGWGASRLVTDLLGFNTLVSPDIVILAFSISVGIGVVFGLYPAWRGSRLNPIEALRYE
jgi:putative ABC transport system permease protein